MSDTADPDDGACRQARMRLALSSFVRRGSLRRASRAIAYRPIASSYARWLGGNTRFACGGPASTGSRSTGTAGLRAHLRFGFCYTVASAAAATSRACSSLRLSHWRLLCGPSSGSNRPLHLAIQSRWASCHAPSSGWSLDAGGSPAATAARTRAWSARLGICCTLGYRS